MLKLCLNFENKENVYVYVITLPKEITITISTRFIQAECTLLPQMYFFVQFCVMER